jgi:hypothetical protein
LSQFCLPSHRPRPHYGLVFFFFCGGRYLNPGPCIFYALSVPTELCSRGHIMDWFRLYNLKPSLDLFILNGILLIFIGFLKRISHRPLSDGLVYSHPYLEPKITNCSSRNTQEICHTTYIPDDELHVKTTCLTYCLSLLF